MKAFVVGLVVSLFIGIMYFAGVFVPVRLATQDARLQYMKMLERRDQLQAIADNLDTYKEKMARIQELLARAREQLPDEMMSADELRAIFEGHAAETGVTVDSLRLGELRETDFLDRQSVNFHFTGTAPAARAFMTRIDNAPLLLQFQEVLVSRSSTQLSVDVRVEALRFQARETEAPADPE